jgi:hypothetical protein
MEAQLFDGDAYNAHMFDLWIPVGPSFAPTEDYLDGVIIQEGDYEFTLKGAPDWTCKVIGKNGAAPLSSILLPVAALPDDQRKYWGDFFHRVCNKLSDKGFEKRREANPDQGLTVTLLRAT